MKMRNNVNDSKSAVFLDVDLTLLNCESFRVFILREYLKADIFSKIKLFSYYLSRRLGRISISQFKKKCLSIFIGMERSEIKDLGISFAKKVLLKHVRPEASKAVKVHRNNRIPVYLLSGSPQFYINELSKQLGLSGSIATELKFDKDNKFTGDFDGNDCLGEEKLFRLSQYCERKGINLKSSFYYSDCFMDLPLLDVIGIPVAVCPDRRLRKVSKQKGWNIEYW